MDGARLNPKHYKSAISSQASNRGRFNDYPAREYTSSDVEVVDPHENGVKI